MAVAPVYEFAVPAPHATFFADGELALAVASPLANAPALSTFYLSRWFDFAGGDYVIRVVADDAASWYASVSRGNSRFVFRNTIEQGVIEASIYLPQGRHRLDITLANVALSGVAPCFVAFSLRRNGQVVYASSGAGWVFDTAPIPDASLPPPGDIRLTLPVFTLTPNWANGIVERVEYKTEVLPSESDEEQRRSLRRFPRRTIEASFLRKDAQRARFENFAIGVGNDVLLVPLWHEQYTLSETLGSTLRFPAGSLLMREFFAGDLVIVSNRNPDDYEILTIATVTLGTDTIGFDSAPQRTWPAGARVTPLRTARVLEAPQISQVTGAAATLDLRFHLVEPLKWPDPSWGYCAPLFRFRANRATPIQMGVDRRVFVLDNETAAPEVTDVGRRSRVTLRLALMLKGRERVYAYRQFVAMARGRSVRFWMPSFSRDLFPIDTVSGDYFDVRQCGLTAYLKDAQEARRSIVFEFNDGRPSIYREIIRSEETIAGERIFVSAPIPQIEPEDLSRVAFVTGSRFDQDSFEFLHRTDSSAVVLTTAVVRSNDRDELPPIECSVTSKPYPLEVFDEVNATGLVVLGASLRDFRYAPEGADFSLGIPAAVLDDVVTTTGMPPEGVDTAAFVTAVVLDESVVGTSTAALGISTALSVQASASLVLALIENQVPPEGVTSGFQVAGATLS